MKTVKAGKNVLVDMGAAERIIGVEFYKVSHLVPREQLQSVSVELPVSV